MFKKLLNHSEQVVSDRLAALCERRDAKVNAKVRVADVLPIERSGISKALYSYALMSHFDFVVTDGQQEPLFGVEFDGPSHDSAAQCERDAMKARLAVRFAFPLLRVRSAHLHRAYDGWDLLSWIVDVWFMQREADRLQAAGTLPYDFDFDPALIVSAPDRLRRFPYWLGLDAQLALQGLHEEGRILDRGASLFDGTDGQGVRRGLAYVRIDRANGVRVAVAMRVQDFPLDLYEPMRGVLLNDILREVEHALAAAAPLVPLPLIGREIAGLNAKCGALSSSLYGASIDHP